MLDVNAFLCQFSRCHQVSCYKLQFNKPKTFSYLPVQLNVFPAELFDATMSYNEYIKSQHCLEERAGEEPETKRKAQHVKRNEIGILFSFLFFLLLIYSMHL